MGILTSLPAAAAALALAACSALSTHQSPTPLAPGKSSFGGGLALGSFRGCVEGDSVNLKKPGCLPPADPYVSFRLGLPIGPEAAGADTAIDVGVKISGIPGATGVLLADLKRRYVHGPIPVSLDFGLSVMPCIDLGEDEEEEAGESDGEGPCHEVDYRGGAGLGALIGPEWLFAHVRYWAFADTWQGLTAVPMIGFGAALGGGRLKIIPSADFLFPGFPSHPWRGMKPMFGLGFQYER